MKRVSFCLLLFVSLIPVPYPWDSSLPLVLSNGICSYNICLYSIRSEGSEVTVVTKVYASLIKEMFFFQY